MTNGRSAGPFGIATAPSVTGFQTGSGQTFFLHNCRNIPYNYSIIMGIYGTSAKTHLS